MTYHISSLGHLLDWCSQLEAYVTYSTWAGDCRSQAKASCKILQSKKKMELYTGLIKKYYYQLKGVHIACMVTFILPQDMASRVYNGKSVQQPYGFYTCHLDRMI